MVNQQHTKTYIWLPVLLIITSLFSCSKEQDERLIPVRYEEVQVNLNLTVPAARYITYSDTKAGEDNISFSIGTISTRSIIDEIENPSIDNIWILQFDDNQTLIRKIYQNNNSENNTFTFELYRSDNTTLFFIANLPAEIDIDLELYTTTIRDLQKLHFNFTENQPVNSLLLTGLYNGKVREEISLDIKLERMITKLSLELSYKETLNNGNKLNITGIRLRNVPIISFYYNSAIIHTPEENPVWFTDYTPQNVSGSGEKFIWYIPENLQGINPYISTQQDKGARNAPAYSTYIELTGEYTESGSSTKQVIISLYPGENITTDFNIYRNAYYPVTVSISNLDPMNDERVTIN